MAPENYNSRIAAYLPHVVCHALPLLLTASYTYLQFEIKIYDLHKINRKAATANFFWGGEGIEWMVALTHEPQIGRLNWDRDRRNEKSYSENIFKFV
jgi:hypothetical protein